MLPNGGFNTNYFRWAVRERKYLFKQTLWPRNYIESDAASKAEDAFEVRGFLYFAIEAVRDSQVEVELRCEVEES